MSNTYTVKAPALTPAQRQENRRKRIQAHAERGSVAIYQVQSFEQLIQEAADLGYAPAQAIAGITASGTLDEVNQVLKLEVMRGRAIQRMEESEALRKPAKKVSHVSGGQTPAPAKNPRKTPAIKDDSVTPSKVRVKPRKSRERVGK